MSIYVGNSEPKEIYIGNTSVKEVYVGTTKVRPSGWTPGTNTIAYYKFDGNLNDSSGNGRNLSMQRTVSGELVFTYGTESGGGKYAYMPKNNFTDNYASMPYNSASYNISFWAKRVGSVTSGGNVMDFNTNGGSFPRIILMDNSISFVSSGSTPFPSGFNTGQWHHYCLSISDNSATCYIDGAYYWTGALNSYNNNLSYFRLNTIGAGGNLYYFSRNGNLSELIIEDRPRTAKKIANYYNQTKANYGL